MYENIFFNNFFLNFFLGFSFLTINVLFSVCLSKNASLEKKFFFKEFQPIIIFILIFCFYSFLLNILVILDYHYLSLLIFFTFSLQIIYTIKNFYHLKSLFKINLKLDEKLIILVFFSLFLVSILPLSDADSISIYQYIPTAIFSDGLEKINLTQNLEFTLLSNTEVVLLLSPILKSDNLGSQLNLITIFFFVVINFKKNKNFSLIILSSPLIIYFISAQKLQLFFGIIYLLLFILLKRDLIKNKIELFIFVILLTFYSTGKFSYIMFSIPLYAYFFYKNFDQWKKIILYSLLSFIIIYIPLLSIKQIYFNNILAPFFDNLLGGGLESYNAFVSSIRSSEGWIGDPTNLLLYIRPFISFDLAKLSSSLGLIFLLMFFNIKLHKETKYFPLLIVILVLMTGQILPRYYFEAFLILAYFYTPKHFFVKFLIYSQVFVIFLISIIYIFISYVKFDVVRNKFDYMNEFSYSFFNSNQHKYENLNGNVLDFSLDRHSIFFQNNIYSIRYINILSQYNGNYDKNLMNYIDKNSIDYLIVRSIKQIPECIITKEIDKTSRQVAVRNFLAKRLKTEYKILKIKDIKCNNIIK